MKSKYSCCAEVVELADALDSGSSGVNPVRVQVPPSAPLFFSGRGDSPPVFDFERGLLPESAKVLHRSLACLSKDYARVEWPVSFPKDTV